MPYDVPPDLAGMSLADIAQAVAARKLPPVATWDPAESGDSHMRIARDGRWYHEGSEIARAAMVRAFSGLLRRDDDGFWLVVPYQKLSIEVEDAPFVATDVRAVYVADDAEDLAAVHGQADRVDRPVPAVVVYDQAGAAG